MDLHREPESRRSIDGTEGHEDLARLRHGGTEATGRRRHAQPMQPGVDDRTRGARIERIPEVQAAQAGRGVGQGRRDGRLHGAGRRRKGWTSVPAALASISAVRRRSRVSGRLALTTQCVAAFRYDGGRFDQAAHAASSAWNRTSSSSLKSTAACSYP